MFIRYHFQNMQDILLGTCPSLEQKSPQEEGCWKLQTQCARSEMLALLAWNPLMLLQPHSSLNWKQTNLSETTFQLGNIILLYVSEIKRVGKPVDWVWVVTHAANQVIVLEVLCNRLLKCFLIASSQRYTSTVPTTQCFYQILNIHLDSIHTTACKIAVEIVIKLKNFLGVYNPNSIFFQDVHDNVSKVPCVTRWLDWIGNRWVVFLHCFWWWQQATPITSQSMPDVNKSVCII